MWIVVVLIVFVVLGALLAVIFMLRARGGLPPTDYKQLFTMGVIFVGAGLPIWIAAGMPVLFLVGLVFMGAAGFNRDKWEENAEANKWENLTEEQRAGKKMLMLTLAGTAILGLVVFALVALIAA
jgi:ABC-type antimicrobial peptide transport system permease subunit